jgi:hypothetical protein
LKRLFISQRLLAIIISSSAASAYRCLIAVINFSQRASGQAEVLTTLLLAFESLVHSS